MTNGEHGPDQETSHAERQQGELASPVEQALNTFRQSMADLVGSDELPSHPEWEAIRSKHRQYEMLAINTGRVAGVPEAYLQRFAAEVVEREIRGGD